MKWRVKPDGFIQRSRLGLSLVPCHQPETHPNLNRNRVSPAAMSSVFVSPSLFSVMMAGVRHSSLCPLRQNVIYRARQPIFADVEMTQSKRGSDNSPSDRGQQIVMTANAAGCLRLLPLFSIFKKTVRFSCINGLSRIELLPVQLPLHHEDEPDSWIGQRPVDGDLGLSLREVRERCLLRHRDWT